MRLTVYIGLFIICTGYIAVPKKLEKKIQKEIVSVFSVPEFNKELVSLDEEVLSKLSTSFNKEGFFKVSSNEACLGYYYYSQAPSKTAVFDYLVVLDQQLIVKKIKILVYREDHGGEIGSKRWLKQFYESTPSAKFSYGRDIKAISGATISAESMTDAVNALLQDLVHIPTDQ